MGPREFGAQYQQNPIVADGNQIRLDWFGEYDEQPERNFFHKVVQSWDTAATDRSTSDFSVGQTWGYRDGEWSLLDLVRGRLEFPELKSRVLAWHRRWKADVLIIEGASTGHSLYQEVKRAGLPGLIRCPSPREDLLTRLVGRTAQLAAGNYLLPASAPWLSALRHELVAFPDGRNDDQVASFVQFLEFAFFSDGWVRREAGDKIAAMGNAIGSIFGAIFGKKAGKIIGAVTQIGMSVVQAFGGARAMGGPVSAGKTYLVGERGPELFTPRSMGAIIPNYKLPAVPDFRSDGGGSRGVTININAKDAVLTHQVRQWVAEGMQVATMGGAMAGSADAQTTLRRQNMRRIP